MQGFTPYYLRRYSLSLCLLLRDETLFMLSSSIIRTLYRDISVAFAAERRKTAEQMRHRSNQLRDNRESSGGGGGGRERGYESYRRGDDRSGGRGQDYGGQDDRSRDDYRSSRRPYDSRDNLRGSREDYRPYESFRDVSRGPGDRNRGDNPYSRDDDRHGRGDRWHDSGKGGSAYGDNRGGSAYGDNRGGSESIYGGGVGGKIRPSPDYSAQRRHIRPHYSMPPGDEVRPREINESEVRGVGNEVKNNASPSSSN